MANDDDSQLDHGGKRRFGCTEMVGASRCACVAYHRQRATHACQRCSHSHLKHDVVCLTRCLLSSCQCLEFCGIGSVLDECYTCLHTRSQHSVQPSADSDHVSDSECSVSGEDARKSAMMDSANASAQGLWPAGHSLQSAMRPSIAGTTQTTEPVNIPSAMATNNDACVMPGRGRPRARGNLPSAGVDHTDNALAPQAQSTSGGLAESMTPVTTSTTAHVRTRSSTPHDRRIASFTKTARSPSILLTRFSSPSSLSTASTCPDSECHANARGATDSVVPDTLAETLAEYDADQSSSMPTTETADTAITLDTARSGQVHGGLSSTTTTTSKGETRGSYRTATARRRNENTFGRRADTGSTGSVETGQNCDTVVQHRDNGTEQNCSIGLFPKTPRVNMPRCTPLGETRSVARPDSKPASALQANRKSASTSRKLCSRAAHRAAMESVSATRQKRISSSLQSAGVSSQCSGDEDGNDDDDGRAGLEVGLSLSSDTDSPRDSRSRNASFLSPAGQNRARDSASAFTAMPETPCSTEQDDNDSDHILEGSLLEDPSRPIVTFSSSTDSQAQQALAPEVLGSELTLSGDSDGDTAVASLSPADSGSFSDLDADRDHVPNVMQAAHAPPAVSGGRSEPPLLDTIPEVASDLATDCEEFYGRPRGRDTTCGGSAQSAQIPESQQQTTPISTLPSRPACPESRSFSPQQPAYREENRPPTRQNVGTRSAATARSHAVNESPPTRVTDIVSADIFEENSQESSPELSSVESQLGSDPQSSHSFLDHSKPGGRTSCSEDGNRNSDMQSVDEDMSADKPNTVTAGHASTPSDTPQSESQTASEAEEYLRHGLPAGAHCRLDSGETITTEWTMVGSTSRRAASNRRSKPGRRKNARPRKFSPERRDEYQPTANATAPAATGVHSSVAASSAWQSDTVARLNAESEHRPPRRTTSITAECQMSFADDDYDSSSPAGSEDDEDTNYTPTFDNDYEEQINWMSSKKRRRKGATETASRR